jgi:Ca2+/H+ antiporter
MVTSLFEDLSLLTRGLNVAGLCVIAVGLAYRFRPRRHIPLMLSAFVLDLTNVVLVEVYARQTAGRGAVEQGVSAFTSGGTALQQFHIAVSVLCILAYVVAVVTGTRLYRRNVGRQVHRANAVVFLATRLSSFITSFWM